MKRLLKSAGIVYLLVIAGSVLMIYGMKYVPHFIDAMLAAMIMGTVVSVVLVARILLKESRDRKAWQKAVASADYPDPRVHLRKVVNDLLPPTFLKDEVHKGLDRLDRESAALLRQKLALDVLKATDLAKVMLPGQAPGHEGYMDVDRHVLAVLPPEPAKEER